MIWRTVNFGQFIQFVIIQFDQIHLFHGIQQTVCIVKRFAQIDVENLEFRFLNQLIQSRTRNLITSRQTTENESVGFGHTLQGLFLQLNSVPSAGIDYFVACTAALVQLDFHQAGSLIRGYLQQIGIDVFTFNLTQQLFTVGIIAAAADNTAADTERFQPHCDIQRCATQYFTRREIVPQHFTEASYFHYDSSLINDLDNSSNGTPLVSGIMNITNTNCNTIMAVKQANTQLAPISSNK